MMADIAQPAVFSLIIACLGYFIKIWIQSLEKKIDAISIALAEKTDKEDLREHLRQIEKQCDKQNKRIEGLFAALCEKCDTDDFSKHSHTEVGKVVLN